MNQVPTQDELLALLEWQVELGVTEAVGADPVNRFELPETPLPILARAAGPGPVRAASPAPPPRSSGDDPVAVARAAAAGPATLEALQQALSEYEHCELKRGARSLVFADGNPAARVMVIGEAPGRDEDRLGRPFVGRAGQLLDRMLAAIGLDRGSPDPEAAVYITNVLPWRPPQNRDPKPEEIAMLLPFLERHVALAAPQVIVAMGNICCQALLGRRGITRLRGQWTEAFGLPALPMFHPAYLLRNAHAKREAWHDLLLLKSRLKGD